MHSLYRYFSAEGALLYIGISNAPFKRIGQHKAGRRDAMREVARIDIEWFDTKAEAVVAEKQAVASECPPWNDHFSTTPEAKARRVAYAEPNDIIARVRASKW